MPDRSKLDQIWDRPGRAAAALAVGLLVGVTAAAAVGAADDDPARTTVATTTVTAPTTATQPSTSATTTEKAEKPKPNKQRPKTERRPRSVEAARSSVQRVIDDAGVPAGVAILPLYRQTPVVAGDASEYQAWSALKIPVIASYLSNFQTPDAKAQQRVQQAIVQSSNEDVRALYQTMISKLGGVEGANAALQSTLAEGGARISGLPNRIDPSINSVAFGESRWTPEDAARFLQALARGCLRSLSEENARTILTHMNNVSNGRWGALTEFPSDRTFAKGGWGSGTEGWTVSQTAIVGRGQDALVLAMMSRPGSYEAGQALMNRLAAAVRRGAGTPSRGVRLPSMDCR